MSLLLGVWQVVSPFALCFAGAATWIIIMLGLFVILFDFRRSSGSITTRRRAMAQIRP
jgi:hypothetical protein